MNEGGSALRPNPPPPPPGPSGGLRFQVLFDVAFVGLLGEGGLLQLVVQDDVDAADGGGVAALVRDVGRGVPPDERVVDVLGPVHHLRANERGDPESYVQTEGRASTADATGRAACSGAVELLDSDPPGRRFDPRRGHGKICAPAGPLSEALNPTLLQGGMSPA